MCLVLQEYAVGYLFGARQLNIERNKTSSLYKF
jgi:hypothetical protein